MDEIAAKTVIARLDNSLAFQVEFFFLRKFRLEVQLVLNLARKDSVDMNCLTQQNVVPTKNIKYVKINNNNNNVNNNKN